MATVRSIRKLLVEIGADTTELDKKVLDSAARIESVGQNLTQMGTSLSLRVTAPLLALGTGAVTSSVRLEDAMAGVAKTVDASADQIARLGDEFKDLSEEIPVAAVELANIGEAAGQLGIETENILKFTRVMADLGVATNLSSDEAATALARLANITQMPEEEFDRLGSTVVALGNNLATTEREIVDMSLRLAGAGKQVGLTEAQILALAGSLSSVGIEAEAGGTALSKVMAEIAKAVGEGGEQLENFAQIAGMTSEEFKLAFAQDAADTLVSFVEGLGELSDAGVNIFQVLESVEFGNVRVRQALLNAAGAGDLMRRSLDLASEAWRKNTALADEANRFYQTTGNRLRTAWNEVKNLTSEIGDALAPVLLNLIDTGRPVLGLLRDLVAEFNDLPPIVQATGIAMVAMTAAAGPLLVVLGQLTTAVGILKSAQVLGGLATALATGAPVLAGLAALSTAFILVQRNADAASDRIGALQRRLDQFGSSLPEKSGETLLSLEQAALRDVEKFEERRRRFARSAAAAAPGSALRSNFLRELSEASSRLGQAQNALAAIREEMQSRLTLPGVSMGEGGAPPTFEAAAGGRTAADVFEDLNKETEKNLLLSRTLGDHYDVLSAQIATYRGALVELIDLGLDPTSAEYEITANALVRLLDLQESLKETTDRGTEAFQRQAEALQELFEAMNKASAAASLLDRIGLGPVASVVRGVTGILGPAATLIPGLGEFFGFGSAANSTTTAQFRQGAPTSPGDLVLNFEVVQDGVSTTKITKRQKRDDAVGLTHRLSLPAPALGTG